MLGVAFCSGGTGDSPTTLRDGGRNDSCGSSHATICLWSRAAYRDRKKTKPKKACTHYREKGRDNSWQVTKEGEVWGKDGQVTCKKLHPPTLCYTLQQLESSQLQRIHTWLKVAATVHMWFIPWFTSREGGLQEKCGEGGTFREPRKRSLGHQGMLFVEITVVHWLCS